MRFLPQLVSSSDFFSTLSAMPWLQALVFVLIAVVIAVVVTALTALIVRRIARKKAWAGQLIKRARMPFRVFILVLALWIAVQATDLYPDWRDGLIHAALVLA